MHVCTWFVSAQKHSSKKFYEAPNFSKKLAPIGIGDPFLKNIKKEGKRKKKEERRKEEGQL